MSVTVWSGCGGGRGPFYGPRARRVPVFRPRIALVTAVGAGAQTWASVLTANQSPELGFGSRCKFSSAHCN
ncbi:hypothetical protein NDU88_003254 [Pleurodeles waltl]|uniref:Uncharacterized protein n=1 Tax=Pleurodeles waltl TaxID=8319 RepID=A0AAV7QCF6_PLEWA|nr:hypothetical protein NDU88_003254 [Pleurodeles waltl]